MIIVKLKGGLGNQLFQYACAKHLAEQNNDVLKLDLGWYRGGVAVGDTARTYGLDKFAISAQGASEDEIRSVGGRPSALKRLIKKVVGKLRPINSYLFDQSVLGQKENVHLEGFFQSERYFKEIESIIRNEFQLKGEMGDAARVVLQDIEQTNAVAIHVRRGDYVNNKNANAFHGVCSQEYYHQAIELIAKRIDSPKYFVFSDDIEWVKDHIEIPNAVFVSQKDIADYEELILMSKCKHNIIANSSFSWWGAWLNAKPNKIVIAPKQWVSDARVNTADAVPESWIRI